MTAIGVLQILVLLRGGRPGVTKPLGLFMARVFQGERTFLHPVLRPLERAIYRLGGVREDVEQRWTQYAGALLAFSLAKFLFTYAHPAAAGPPAAQPAGIRDRARCRPAPPPITPDLAFNTAVSFVTNTNWQAYVGEATIELLRADGGADGAELHVGRRRHRGRDRARPRVRQAGVEDDRQLLGGHDPGHRLRAAAALVRGRARVRLAGRRAELGSVHAGHDGRRAPTQTIAQGPVASQEAIKELGTNGGGFFNANSAHPVREPDAVHDALPDRPDLRDRRRPDLHVRTHGPGHRGRAGRCSPR